MESPSSPEFEPGEPGGDFCCGIDRGNVGAPGNTGPGVFIASNLSVAAVESGGRGWSTARTGDPPASMERGVARPNACQGALSCSTICWGSGPPPPKGTGSPSVPSLLRLRGRGLSVIGSVEGGIWVDSNASIELLGRCRRGVGSLLLDDLELTEFLASSVLESEEPGDDFWCGIGSGISRAPGNIGPGLFIASKLSVAAVSSGGCGGSAARTGAADPPTSAERGVARPNACQGALSWLTRASGGGPPLPTGTKVLPCELSRLGRFSSVIGSVEGGES
jgi:hypothetical protein